MNTSKRVMMAVAATALVFSTAGCETDPVTGQQTMTRGGKGAAAGAMGGALLGGLIGGNATGALVGASIGALAGGGAGAYMDKQERQLRAQTAGTGIVVERQGDAIKLEMPSSVTFAFNSAELQPQFMPALNQVAQTLASYQSTYVQVNGHTDSVGSDAANLRLSQQRAQAVANYLAGNGVNQARITTQGFGASQPIATNATEEGRAQNRRVEIRLTPIVQQQNGQPNPPPR
jgi:outer membrane protein OmpA-like peptidoglycan-associated protein